MGLLAPWFLAGLGLLGLPVYLHLLKRHRSETQQFSSLMFFERSTEAALKHRRLDYLLLLACRLALLALMALAFAQPFIWRHDAGLLGQKPRLVVIDDSASMGFAGRMEEARKVASGLLTANSKLAAFDSRLRLMGAQDLASLQAGTSRSSLGELARALRSYQESVKTPLEVHLVSDLQRSSMPEGFSDLRLGAETTLILHAVGKEKEPNWTVENVTASARVRDGKTSRVQATIAGFHTSAATKAVVLEINGKPVARQSVAVPADGRAKVEFVGMDLPYGFSKCAVKLEAGDGLPADDAYLFAVERTDPQRVVTINGDHAGRSALYFHDALDAVAGDAYSVEGQGSIERAAFVVLFDVGRYDDAALKHYVEQGGAVLAVVGPAAVAAGRVPVTAQVARASRYASRGAERYQSVGAVDESYAAISKADKWAGVRFYQTVEVDAGQARVLARLTDGTPLLMEQKVGEGTVVVLASPLDNLANDFPVHPAFLPFVEQIARRLSGGEEAAVNLAVDAALDFQGGAGAKAFEALDPDGRRALTLAESAKGVPLVFSRAGFWQVRRGAGKSQMIAANIDRRESDLEAMPTESAELWQGGGAGATGGGKSGENDQQKALGIYILAVALIAGMCEVAVGSRHLSRESA